MSLLDDRNAEGDMLGVLRGLISDEDLEELARFEHAQFAKRLGNQLEEIRQEGARACKDIPFGDAILERFDALECFARWREIAASEFDALPESAKAALEAHALVVFDSYCAAALRAMERQRQKEQELDRDLPA